MNMEITRELRKNLVPLQKDHEWAEKDRILAEIQVGSWREGEIRTVTEDGYVAGVTFACQEKRRLERPFSLCVASDSFRKGFLYYPTEGDLCRMLRESGWAYQVQTNRDGYQVRVWEDVGGTVGCYYGEDISFYKALLSVVLQAIYGILEE